MIPAVVVEWLAPYAEQFFALKGLIGVVSTVLLVVHMMQTWGEPLTAGRRLRYYALLFASFIVTGASYEQIYDDAVVNWRNIGGFVAAALITVAAIVSIVEDSRDKGARRR